MFYRPELSEKIFRACETFFSLSLPPFVLWCVRKLSSAASAASFGARFSLSHPAWHFWVGARERGHISVLSAGNH